MNTTQDSQPSRVGQSGRVRRLTQCILLAALILGTAAPAVFSQTVSTIFDGVNNPIRLEFWDTAGGTFTWDDNSYDPTDDWSAPEIAAIERGIQYWWDVLGDDNTPGGTPISVRVMKDAFVGANARSDNSEITVGGRRTTFVQRLWADFGNDSSVEDSSNIGVDTVLLFGTLPWTTDINGPLPVPGTGMEAVMIHEMAHSLGYYASLGNVGGEWLFGFDDDGNEIGLTVYESFLEHANGTPLAAGDIFDLSNPSAYWFTGANAVAVFGDRINTTNVTHLSVDPLLMTHESFRNYPFFTELELAVLQDLGYAIDRTKFFGKSYYQDGANETNNLDFNSTKTYGLGLHMKANNLNIVQTGNLNASGSAGNGIRIDGEDNTVTIGPGVAINTNGDFGVGVLVSNGVNNTVVHRGSISAMSTTSGQQGTGMLFSFGNNLLGFDTIVDPSDPNFLDVYRDSRVAGGYLVDRVDISGTVSAGGDAIRIDQTAAVREINILNGASLTGDIRSDALIDNSLNLHRPTITFGRLADVNGAATSDADANFNFNYSGIIGGTTEMDASFVGGGAHATGAQLSGLAIFHSTTIGADGRLTSDGTLQANTTVTNDGALSVTALGQVIAATGNFTNNGVIESNAGDIGSVLGDFINDGDIQSNTGTVSTLVGDIFQNGTLANDGGTVDAANNLDINGTLTSTFGQLNAGGTVTVFNGGRLAGTPTITAPLVDNLAGGTMSAGNSIGTMLMIGDFQTNGTLEFEITHQNLPQDSDLYAIQNGTATINNNTIYANRGTFEFDAEAPADAANYEIARRYTIMETDNPGDLIVVQRPQTTDNIDERRIILRTDTDLAQLYTPDAQNYYAYIGRDVPYASLGTTPNEVAIGEYLDSFAGLDDGSPLGDEIQWFRDSLDLLPDEADVLAVFSQLTGEIYASVNPMVVQQAFANQSMLTGRIRSEQSRLPWCDENGVQIGRLGGWVTGFGSGGRTQSDGNAQGYRYSASGTQAVVTSALDCQTIFGAFYNYSNSSFRDSAAGSAQVEMNEWGGFLSHHNDDHHFLFVASGGMTDFDVNRTLQFGNNNIQLPVAQRMQGDYGGSVASVYGEYGLRFVHPNAVVRPFLGLGYTHAAQQAFQEDGTGFGTLAVGRSSVDSLRSALGADVNFLLFTQAHVTLDVRAAWMHDFLDGGVGSTTAQFAAIPGATFQVSGADIGQDFALLGVALSADVLGNRARAFGGYDLIANRQQSLHAGNVGLEFLW